MSYCTSRNIPMNGLNRTQFHRTTVFRIVSLLLFITACQQLRSAHSFALVVQRRTPISGGCTLGCMTKTTSTRTELSAFATADAEEIHRHRDSSDNNNNENREEYDDYDSSSSSSWTPVAGGFLPRFRPTAKPAPVVREILSLQDYRDLVVQEPEKITVVRFYAPWCRACKAVKAQFYRLSRHYASLSENNNNNSNRKVQFVEVPLTQETAVLHTGLGVPSLPYGHIYHPQAGLVEERKINKHAFCEFENVLQTYVQGYCDVQYNDDHGGEIEWLRPK